MTRRWFCEDRTGETARGSSQSCERMQQGSDRSGSFVLVRDGESEATLRANTAYQDAQREFNAIPDVKISGELVPIYSDGEGIWENRLFRDRFSLSNVKGRIESVYLACQGGRDMRLRHPSRDPWTTPPGWSSCTLEVSGRPGTRFTVHQLAPGGSGGSYP